MSHPDAIESLVTALTAVSEYEDPLQPIYEALGQSRSCPQRPLTFRTIRQQSELLHTHADQARDQTYAIKQVIVACQQLPPIPLSQNPLGF